MNFQSYAEMHEESIREPQKFWGRRLNNLDWVRQPAVILDQSKPNLSRWFTDGLLNITYNLIDRHAAKHPDRVAIIYEGPIAKEVKTMTYGQLLDAVSKLAGAMSELGLRKGDCAMVYMPMILESAVAVLACARLGVIHSVVFGGFSSKELAHRIQDCNAKIVLTASCGLEPHKMIDFPHIVREAKKLAETPDIKVIIVDRVQKPAGKLEQHEYLYADLLAKAMPHAGEVVESTHPLYILYTSGTTGQPKGIFRDVGGTSLGIMLSMEIGLHFDYGKRIFATSDIGWVVGHSYMLYGPLLFGGSTIFYEGKPTNTPDVSSYFRIIENYKPDVFYTSPTAMRTVKKEDPQLTAISKYDLTSLKVFGIVGERTDIYTYEYIKKMLPEGCLYNDTYWQTETGWFLSANFSRPERFATKGGSCTKAYPGWNIQIMDEGHQQVVTPKVLGHVVAKLPTPPGFMLGLWQNEDFFVKKYFSDFQGYYYTGDAGYFDDEGYLHIVTRTDDIINVSGHRLSTAQMEEATLKHKDVAEAAVVGIKDTIKGQSPFALVVLKKDVKSSIENIAKEINLIIRDEIGPVASIHSIFAVARLPKTRSGKILRGTISKIVDNAPWKFPETIEDAETLEFVKRVAEEYHKTKLADIVFDNQIDHPKNEDSF